MLDIAQKQRNLALKADQRDRGICQICLRPKTNIEAHHIIPLSEGGKDRLANLITLCVDCHRKHGWEETRRLVESRVL